MKLASLKAGGRDGALIVVSRDLTRALAVAEIAPNLQSALDDWTAAAPRLRSVYENLNRDAPSGFTLDVSALAAPLPRAYQWLDGSAYLSHVERVRRARGAGMPANAFTDPLMYQGNSAGFSGPCDPIEVADEAWGVDFEAEIAVITGDVPRGVIPAEARAHIALLMLVNDISLRYLIPAELAKGFGFLHGKPGPALSPVAVTPDELGEAWDGAKVHLPLQTLWNERPFGQPDAGAGMQFDFRALISHAAKTRPLPAGTVLGSGTVSNADPGLGFSCIIEQRALETVNRGRIETPFMRHGDRLRIEMLDRDGRSIFGAIAQEVRVCGS
ncbi:MAG: fumarylacetoacetate hydrolase family protein [Beijerinckiaceae bacterium]|nr:fumarylacetoacetate hydrolase family protein [Beijerinckiaceae bacterium]